MKKPKKLLHHESAGGGAEGGAYAHHVDACGEAFEVEEVFVLMQAVAVEDYGAVTASSSTLCIPVAETVTRSEAGLGVRVMSGASMPSMPLPPLRLKARGALRGHPYGAAIGRSEE